MYSKFFLCLILGCSCQTITKTDFKYIEELTFLEKKYKIENKSCNTRIYVIDKNVPLKSIDTLVSNFVRVIKDTISKNYDQVGLVFYKKSKITNKVHLLQNPRDLDRYSQEKDMLWTYTIESKNIVSSLKYENGDIIYPKSKVVVEDIKD
jgi:hypothetical protein